MNKDTSIKLFDQKQVRTLWNEENEKWFFSIVDVVGILTENDHQKARNYWKVLKYRLNKEGNETVTNCNRLKMLAADEISNAWTGLNTKQYKKLKNLKKENLRDNMTNLELVLNMLAEASTTEIAIDKDTQGFEENKKAAQEGGKVAQVARKQLEDTTGKKVVTSTNYLDHKKQKELKESKKK